MTENREQGTAQSVAGGSWRLMTDGGRRNWDEALQLGLLTEFGGRGAARSRVGSVETSSGRRQEPGMTARIYIGREEGAPIATATETWLGPRGVSRGRTELGRDGLEMGEPSTGLRF